MNNDPTKISEIPLSTNMVTKENLSDLLVQLREIGDGCSLCLIKTQFTES